MGAIREYRVRSTAKGWVVEIRDNIKTIVGGTRVREPEWELAEGPFATEEEALAVMERLTSGR
jgi:hypothetical protein